MSAPAMKLSGLPEMSTTARIVGIVAEPDEQRLELDLDRGAELVYRLARQIEGDDGDAGLDGGREGGHSVARSSTMATPIPPCAQIEIRPNCTSRRRISLASVVTIRAPGGAERMSDGDRAADDVGALRVDLADRAR